MLLCGFLALTGCPDSTTTTAQDFTLKDLDGKDVSLSSYRGKAVLVNFWAVGCPPCRSEIPHLVQIYNRLGDSGFVILGVNAWDEPTDTVKNFVKEQGIRYPVLLMGSGVAEKYNVQGIPTNLFIDPRGMIAARELGFRGESAMEDQIKKILPKKSG